MWYYGNIHELYHYGIKGMKWGVRRSKKYLKKDSGKLKMNMQLFAKRADDLEPIQLHPAEYARVLSDFMLHTTKEQRKKKVIHKANGNHTYTFRKRKDGTFDIINRVEIPDAITKLFERDKYEK